MKTPLVIALTIGSIAAGLAQTPPSSWAPSVQTVGGVTYLVGTATVLGCHEIQFSPVTTAGTNLQMTVEEVVYYPCIQCVDCYYTNLTATVLGHLAAGDYQLLVDASLLGEPPSPWLVIHFTVPTQSGSTLFITRAGSNVQIAVNGVPAATYVLQTSATLTNWTPVYTNSGSAFQFSSDVTGAPFQFYRVQVQSGTIPSP